MAIRNVRYSHLKTANLGEIWFAESDRGIWRIQFGSSKLRFLEELHADEVSATADDKSTAPTRRLIAEYFAGKREKFPVRIDWSRVDGFIRKALQACARIPHGKTLSYGEVAERAGSPGAARAVGQAMAKNPFPIVVPCHRVLAANGKLGGFSGGLHYKRALLELEKIELGGGQKRLMLASATKRPPSLMRR